MAPMFSDFRRLRKRIKRTLSIGSRGADTISGPLTEMIVDYFDAHSPYDYMDLESSSNISRAGLADSITMVVAMVYLDRLRIKDKAFFEASEPTDLYVPALILASKFLHDADSFDRATNSDWAEVMEMSLDGMNTLERNLVNNLGWDVNVRPDDFENWLSSTEKWVAWNMWRKHNSPTYNELSILVPDCKSQEFLKDIFALVGAFAIVYTVSVFSIFAASMAITSIPLHTEFKVCNQDRFIITNEENMDSSTNCPTIFNAVINANNRSTLEYCLQETKTDHIHSAAAEDFLTKDMLSLDSLGFEKTPFYAFIQLVYS